MADLIIQQGTDSGYAWPILTSDGEPFDLTGYSARAQVRTRNGNKLYEFSTSLGNIIIAINQIILTWTSIATATWDWSGGVYDLELISPLGAVRRIDQGWITVVREVTR